MSKIGSAAKVKLNSFDDLFGTDQPQAGTEQVQEIALSELLLGKTFQPYVAPERAHR